jgi:CO dehydrogenase nickel-insertion accessory protein CooC1
MQKLQEDGIEPIGSVRYDAEVVRLSLMDEPLKASAARIDIGNVVDYLEAFYAKL